MSSQKCKILIIVPTLSPGGSERFVSILFNSLDRNIFDVRLAVLNSKNIFYKLNYEEGVYYLNRKDVRSSLWALMKVIGLEKPRIILSTITSLNILLSFIRILYPRFKLVIRESTVLSIHFERIRNSYVYETLIKLLYPFSDKIICQSTDMKKDLARNYHIKEDKLIVINNPIDLKQFRGNKGESHGKIRLVTVARLDPAKGYDRILLALSLLKIEFEYFIVGDMTDHFLLPKFTESLIQLGLQQKIIMVGVKTNPQEFLSAADFYLHGSYYEGFPNVLLEAGAVGIPVITFDTSSVREIVIHGENGLIVPDHDITAFAKAIELAAKVPFDSEKIKSLISARFNVPIIIDKYQKLFNEIIML